MRIEVLVDVKTMLGEGPLWDVEQERLYWIDSFDGRVFRAHRCRRRNPLLGRAAEDRLDGAAQRRRRRGRLAGARLPSPRFQERRSGP